MTRRFTQAALLLAALTLAGAGLSCMSRPPPPLISDESDIVLDIQAGGTYSGGDEPRFTCRITRADDGRPVVGYLVTYTDPGSAGHFAGGASSETVRTDSQGEASALFQLLAGPGVFIFQVTVLRPADPERGIEEKLIAADDFMFEVILSAPLNCEIKGPGEAVVGQNLEFKVIVTNSSGVQSDEISFRVVVSDELEATGPHTFRFPPLSHGEVFRKSITVRAIAPGTGGIWVSAVSMGGAADSDSADVLILAAPTEQSPK